jgi:hypothetical protein
MSLQTAVLIKNVKVHPYTQADFDSAMVGPIAFTKDLIDDVVSITATNTLSGLTQTVIVGDFTDTPIGSEFSVVFSTMGFFITGQSNVSQTFPIFNSKLLRTSAIADAICNPATDIYIRSSLPVDITIPFMDPVLPAKAKADLSLGDYKGWVLYNVPSASVLAADGLTPVNSWAPYYGDWTGIGIIDVPTVNRIKADRKKPLIMPSGVTVSQFKYVWSDWSVVNDVYKTKKYDGTESSLQFTLITLSGIKANRITGFVNGIAVDNSNLSIVGSAIDFSPLVASLKPGDALTIRYKKYEPSQTEINFDPDSDPTTDNPLLLQQYKYDYQYTIKETRDDSGQLISTKYYFWVANKNIASQGRLLSLQQAKNLLTANTNPYAVLQNITEQDGVQKYDQFISAGLSRYVTEDDTYKIRFTRDFILRDDPMNIDLKNIHTEWAIIREQQKTKIPEQLWSKLTDAACGTDLAGNAIPSLARVAYDERNGTATRYGFESDQAFVDSTLALNSIKYAILNTSVKTISPSAGGIEVPDPIEFIDQSKIDGYFADPVSIRKTMNDIWTNAKPQQINEIFFTVLNDALSENYEFSDIFKTSMIAAHSVRLLSTLGAL